jgi:putative sterol carrier protein
MMTRIISVRFDLVTAILLAALCLNADAATETEHVTPQEVFDGMRESFRPEKAKGLFIRYQFELSGPNGGQWCIEVKDGTYKMGKGKIDNPNVTFVASDKDWVALCSKKLNGVWAFITGRLRVRGDQSLARKLGEIFP